MPDKPLRAVPRHPRDTLPYQRLTQRTTVAGDRPTTAQPARYEPAAE